MKIRILSKALIVYLLFTIFLSVKTHTQSLSYSDFQKLFHARTAVNISKLQKLGFACAKDSTCAENTNGTYYNQNTREFLIILHKNTSEGAAEINVNYLVSDKTKQTAFINSLNGSNYVYNKKRDCHLFKTSTYSHQSFTLAPIFPLREIKYYSITYTHYSGKEESVYGGFK
ncbi:MAG: hypothetical protein IPO21_00560 [Bacteroidales bacterium]|nr:hypothetical protein [Bacteroidales bacterium]